MSSSKSDQAMPQEVTSSPCRMRASLSPRPTACSDLYANVTPNFSIGRGFPFNYKAHFYVDAINER